MTRKEIYEKIKLLGIEQEIKDEFGDNYTRIKTSDLEKCVNRAEKKSNIQSYKSTEPTKKSGVKALVKLVSYLTQKKVITADEAIQILDVIE